MLMRAILLLLGQGLRGTALVVGLERQLKAGGVRLLVEGGRVSDQFIEELSLVVLGGLRFDDGEVFLEGTHT